MFGRDNRTLLELERLEARIVPANVKVVFRNDAIIITGTRFADSIDIVDNPSGTSHDYTIFGVGSTTVNGAPFVNRTYGPRLPRLVVSMGAGNDTVSFYASWLFASSNAGFGRTVVNLGAGNDTMTVDSANFASLVVAGGRGNDTLDIERPLLPVTNDNLVIGPTRINMGNGNDTVNLGWFFNPVVDFRRGLTIAMGNGTDSVNIDNVTVFKGVKITQGNGPGTIFTGTMQVGRGFGIGTGNSNDSITLTDTNVGGGLKINAGRDNGTDSVSLYSTRVRSLVISTGPNRTGIETVLLQVVVVLSGKTVINTGSGADNVDIQEGTFGGPVRINTGTGNDTVTVSGFGGFFSAFNSTFFRPVVISMGAGDDTLTLMPGTKFDSTRRSVFNGGTGNDNFTDFGVLYLVPPIVKNFP